eukprot:Pgem_evm1s19114
MIMTLYSILEKIGQDIIDNIENESQQRVYIHVVSKQKHLDGYYGLDFGGVIGICSNKEGADNGCKDIEDKF